MLPRPRAAVVILRILERARCAEPLAIDRWIKRRPGDFGLSARLFDAMQSGFEIEILRQRHCRSDAIQFFASQVLPKRLRALV